MKVALFLLPLLTQAVSLNVLFASFHDSGSHQGSMSKLFLKLAKSGHNVTVIDTTSKNGLPDYGSPNVHLVDMRCGEDYHKKFNIHRIWWETMPGALSLSQIFVMGDLFFNDLIKEKSNLLPELLATDFDVIVMDDLFTIHGIFISELLYQRKGVPTIQYGTTFQLAILQSARAHGHIFFNEPSNAGPLPKDITEVYDPRRFTSRIVNFYTKFAELFIMPRITEYLMVALNRVLGRKISLQDHYSKSALVLTEAFSGLGFPISQGNDFHSVGAHCPKIGTLDKEMEEFVNDPKSKGTIMLAFGSHVRWHLAPQYIVDAYFGAFENLTDYRIVFSYNGEPRAVPKHIKLSPWAPQKEILNHPKTKVFIGHSGLKSTNEAICAGVPLVLMPSFADQKYNSEFFAHLGYSEFMNKYYLTKEIVLENIFKVLNNLEEKRTKMSKLRSIYLDKVIEPMDLAEFYVVRTAKKKENVVFRRKGIFLSWNEYLDIDLFVCLIGLIWLVSK